MPNTAFVRVRYITSEELLIPTSTMEWKWKTRTEKLAVADPYAMPGSHAGEIPYVGGLPIPKGMEPIREYSPPLTAVEIERARFVLPERFKKTAPCDRSEPTDPTMPHEDRYLSVKRRKWPIVVDPYKSVASFSAVAIGREESYMHFGEAFRAPRSKCAWRKGEDQHERYEPKRPKSKRKHTKDSRVSSLLRTSTARINKKISDMKHDVSLGLRDSADGIDRLAFYAEHGLRDGIAFVNNRVVRIDKRPVPPEKHYTFTDRLGNKQHIAIHRGLAPFEIEHTIRGDDWTRDYECVLSITQFDWNVNAKVSAALYLNDLPARFQEGVPWGSSSQTKCLGEEIYEEVACECCEDHYWTCRAWWQERAPQPRWAAVTTMNHLTRFGALNQSPFEVMKNGKVNR